jgi:uncharacterized protein DUF6480
VFEVRGGAVTEEDLFAVHEAQPVAPAFQLTLHELDAALNAAPEPDQRGPPATGLTYRTQRFATAALHVTYFGRTPSGSDATNAQGGDFHHLRTFRVISQRCGQAKHMTAPTPDSDPAGTTRLKPHPIVPPGETPPAEGGMSGTGPRQDPPRGWAMGPLIAIGILAVVIAGFFLAYAILVQW